MAEDKWKGLRQANFKSKLPPVPNEEAKIKALSKTFDKMEKAGTTAESQLYVMGTTSGGHKPKPPRPGLYKRGGLVKKKGRRRII